MSETPTAGASAESPPLVPGPSPPAPLSPPSALSPPSPLSLSGTPKKEGGSPQSRRRCRSQRSSQADVADTVAEVIEREVLSQHTIRTELERLDVSGRLDAFVRRVVREKAGRKLQSIPLIGAFINDRTLGMIEQAAVDAVHEEADKMRDHLAEDLEKHLQIRDIVRQRVAESCHPSASLTATVVVW